MHLFSKDHLAASSGIVGAEGPTAVGFALAARHLRPGAVAVAFFGDGAMNQGMLLESLNLAAVWNLPVLFVCKDDGWAITTKAAVSTGGTLGERVRGLGVSYAEFDGLDVEQVWRTARDALEGARAGRGPAFLHAHCVHLEGHFLGLLLLRTIRHPLRELPGIVTPLMRSLSRRGGASSRERRQGVWSVLGALRVTLRDPRRRSANDPLVRARAALESDSACLKELDDRLVSETDAIVVAALREEPA
jgi:pyruvate dehydrogenase E1 component alpha subunit